MSKPILSRHARGPAVFLRQQSEMMKQMEWDATASIRTPGWYLARAGEMFVGFLLGLVGLFFILPL